METHPKGEMMIKNNGKDYRDCIFQRRLHLCSYSAADTPSSRIDSLSLAALILRDFGARL